MKLLSLTIGNFRSFEQLRVELHPNLTVLVGENASGKTAVLEGLKTALAAFFLGIPDAHTSSGGIDTGDVRRVARQQEGVPGLEAHYPCFVICSALFRDGRMVTWKRALNSPRSRTTRADAKRIKQIAEGLAKPGQDKGAARLPVLAYYGTQRLWKSKNEPREGKDLRTPFVGYWDCLDPASNHKHLSRWMRWQRYGELQEGTPSPHLAAIEAAVKGCVTGSARFFYDVKQESLIFVAEDGTPWPFDLLSDGYRNLVAMVADIAWRAVSLSPQNGADAPTKAAGVVLIDEVDLHLHPRWQTGVLESLRRTFPGIQFVVTTHAPQVIAATPAESLRVLSEGRVLSVGHSYGLDVNSVLQTIMGAPERHPEVQSMLRDLALAVDQREWAQMEESLARLEALLGPDDPALVSARWERDLHERG